MENMRNCEQTLTYISIRHKHDLHQVIVNLTSYQNGVYCAGIKLFIILLGSIRSLKYVIKLFKLTLKCYILCHFYSVEEVTSAENY
jgi:hypothetical protein